METSTDGVTQAGPQPEPTGTSAEPADVPVQAAVRPRGPTRS